MFIESQPYQFEFQIADTRPNGKDEQIHDYNIDKHADDNNSWQCKTCSQIFSELSRWKKREPI